MTATATAWHPGTGGEARLTTLVAAPEGSLGVAHKSFYYPDLRSLQEHNATAEEEDDETNKCVTKWRLQHWVSLARFETFH